MCRKKALGIRLPFYSSGTFLLQSSFGYYKTRYPYVQSVFQTMLQAATTARKKELGIKLNHPIRGKF